MAQQIRITQTSNADMNIGVPKNLTAVEWLAEQLTIRIVNSFQEEIAKAKQMEKEQIMKAHSDGFDHIVVDFKKQEFAEQYYNETYGE
jgi:hypothetical protein